MNAFARPTVLCAALMMASVGPAAAGEETIRLVPGNARDVTATRCVTCHSLDYIPMNGPVMNRASWEKTVRKMIDAFGAPITEAEAAQIVDYLGQHYSSS
jgi:sulfite dehydrogenase (cytochrome) subunit B